jgi:hypothetical protein
MAYPTRLTMLLTLFQTKANFNLFEKAKKKTKSFTNPKKSFKEEHQRFHYKKVRTKFFDPF